ncbi:MAG: hypothetical protein OEN01_07235 [Candidatus Krumholzibacteria bacterium]|nr:hypothetical protein [Candidatus Krumholzibacteria bacterium]
MTVNNLPLANPLWMLAFATATLFAGCGDDRSQVDPDKLCRSGAGVGARIRGTPEPLDMCVSNNQTQTSFAPAPTYRYDVAATTVSDSVEITIGISFQVHAMQPQQLNITSDISEAFSDPDGAWFFYREVKTGMYDYATTNVTGVFTLAISDQNVAAGTFTELRIDLEDVSDGTPAGSRIISEGFFNVTPD